MSHGRICTSHVSIVRINGNIIRVGAPTQSPQDTLFRRTNLAFCAVEWPAVKVVLRHVSERVNLHASVLGSDPDQVDVAR